MTSEEIKMLYPMKEIVQRYGIEIDRNGFCLCPFHHDQKSKSLKIYKDSFYCFGCNASGDIFTFVQKMEGCSFKEAFRILGGQYKHTFSVCRKIEQAKKEKEAKEKAKRKNKQELILLCKKIRIYKKYADKYTPFSDSWCNCIAEWQKACEEWELKFEKEVKQ